MTGPRVHDKGPPWPRSAGGGSDFQGIDVSIPELPDHWDFGGEVHPTQVSRGTPLLVHRLFCIIGFGYVNLQTVWERSHTSAWRGVRNDMKDRTQHINIVVCLS